MKLNLPYRLLFKALVIYLILFVLGLLIFKLALSYSLISYNFLSCLSFFLVFTLICLIAIILYILKPLTRLIQSLSDLVLTQNFSEDQISQVLAYDNIPGEWKDLEIALKKLVRILRKNFKALSREKIEIQAVMNSVEEPIFAIDQSERVIFYNPAFGMFFGQKVGARATLSVHEVLPDVTVINALRKTLKEGNPDETQVDLFIKDQAYSFTLSLSPLKRETDFSTYGAVAVFHDRSLLIETNKKKLDFVANASHELRTPVTTISSAVSLLEKNLEDKEMRIELIENLKENTKRLVNLTEGLLDLSTLESGEKLELQFIKIKDFMTKFLSTNGFNLPNIYLDCPEDLYIQVDSRRLEQILTNLLTNAIRYSPKDKNIYIIWESTKNSIILRVRDEGKGIAPEHAKRIFERFYRVDAARTRSHGGAGIGLAIIKHIMKLHQGEIYVNLDYVNGAEFVCVFPII